MTPEQFTLAMAYVRRLWPQARLPERTSDAWYRLLGDLDADVLVAAIEDLATEGREFPPAAGQLRRRACELTAERVPDADEAWAEVTTAMRRVGSYRMPEWSHPAVAAGVDALGGWYAICRSEDAMADRAHFMRLYGVARERVQREGAMAPSVRALTVGLAAKLALNAGDAA